MSYLALDDQICHSIYSAANALVRAYRPVLEPLGLTYPQYLVMLSLWQQDKVTIKQISEHTRLDPGTLTPILKRLEQKKWLHRQMSASDERQKIIVLTKEGRKLKQKAEKIPEQMFVKGFANVDKNRRIKNLCEELYARLIQHQELD